MGVIGGLWVWWSHLNGVVGRFVWHHCVSQWSRLLCWSRQRRPPCWGLYPCISVSGAGGGAWTPAALAWVQLLSFPRTNCLQTEALLVTCGGSADTLSFGLSTGGLPVTHLLSWVFLRPFSDGEPDACESAAELIFQPPFSDRWSVAFSKVHTLS